MRPASSFCDLRVRLSARAADPVANFLMERGAAGLLDGTPPRSRQAVLTVSFPSRAAAGCAARALGTYARALRRLGLLRGGLRVTRRAVRAGGWADRWKRYARPVRIGRRLLVRPSWVRGGAAGAGAVVTLDPGMAFGTGAHASTRLCLEALARHVAGGERVLDLGTGSGVLAIAAAKLGARPVLAVDSDPVACRVARENVRRNGVARRVRVCHGTLAAAGGPPFDVAVANLTARELAAVLPRLARRVRAGGLAVLSGLLRTQEAAVRRAARAAGLIPAAARRRAGWVALETRRPDVATRRHGEATPRRRVSPSPRPRVEGGGGVS